MVATLILSELLDGFAADAASTSAPNTFTSDTFWESAFDVAVASTDANANAVADAGAHSVADASANANAFANADASPDASADTLVSDEELLRSVFWLPNSGIGSLAGPVVISTRRRFVPFDIFFLFGDDFTLRCHLECARKYFLL